MAVTSLPISLILYVCDSKFSANITPLLTIEYGVVNVAALLGSGVIL